MDRKAADFTFKVSKFQMTLGIELFRFFNEFVTPRFKVTDCTVHRIHSITNMSMRAAAVFIHHFHGLARKEALGRGAYIALKQTCHFVRNPAEVDGVALMPT